jgi:hypothetical protein
MPDAEPPLLADYVDNGSERIQVMARMLAAYQQQRFPFATGAVTRRVQEEVVEGFLRSPLDLSGDIDRIVHSNSEGGGTYGALPALQDLPIVQGMRLGAGLDGLGNRVKSASQCVSTLGLDHIVKQKVIARNDIYYEYRLIRSREELVDFLNLTSSIGVHGGDFDVSVFFDILKDYESNQNKLYAAVKIDARVSDVHIKDPVMLAPAQELFLIDYEQFRKKCGDQFLNVITVGGVYFGFIEIEARNAQSKLQIEARLDVDVSGSVDVNVHVGFDMMVQRAFENENVSVRIHSAGAPSGYEPVTNFYSFMLDVTRFYCNLRGLSEQHCQEVCNRKIQSLREGAATIPEMFEAVDAEISTVQDVNNPDELGIIRGPILNAVYAKFEDYGQVLDALRALSIYEDNFNKALLGTRYDEYYGLYEDMGRMLAFPTLWDIGENDSDIVELRQQVEIYLERIKSLASKCAHPTDRLCVELSTREQIWQYVMDTDPDTADDLSDAKILPSEIRSILPRRREILPRTCTDIQRNQHLFNDDDVYLLYLSGDAGMPYWVYCYGINRGDLAMSIVPEEYLILRNTSLVHSDAFGELVELPNFNYSVFTGLPVAQASNASGYEDIADEYGLGDETDDTIPCSPEAPESVEGAEWCIGPDVYNTYRKGSIITAYQMLKIRVNYDNIAIDPNQYAAFVSHNGRASSAAEEAGGGAGAADPPPGDTDGGASDTDGGASDTDGGASDADGGASDADGDAGGTDAGRRRADAGAHEQDTGADQGGGSGMPHDNSLESFGGPLLEFQSLGDTRFRFVDRYNHAPLAWTKVCDRNLALGVQIGNSGGVIRTANVNLEETPFQFGDGFSMGTNLRFSTNYARVTFNRADRAAADLGGDLLTVVSEQDVASYAQILETLGLAGSWLNLEFYIAENGETATRWRDRPTVHFEPFAGRPLPPFASVQGLQAAYLAVEPTEEDGVGDRSGPAVVLRETDDALAFLVEYTRGDVAYDMSAQRQTLDVYASNIWGDCLTVYPMREMLLYYNVEIAGQLGLIKPEQSEDGAGEDGAGEGERPQDN